MDSYEIIGITSALICVCGTISNTISLSYFIKRENDGLGNRLLMLLNTLDLLVCLSGTVAAILHAYTNWDDQDELQLHISILIYRGFVESTGFATCLLSVTRAISIAAPFCTMKGKYVCFAAGFKFCYYFGLGVWRIYSYHIYIQYVELIIYCAIFITVLISNMVSASKLLKRDNGLGEETLPDAIKQATLTVFILSALFCFFNAIYIVLLCITYNMVHNQNNDPDFTYSEEFTTSTTVALLAGYTLSMPLNSAFNPVVYFYRKQGMRDYINEAYQRIRSIF